MNIIMQTSRSFYRYCYYKYAREILDHETHVSTFIANSIPPECHIISFRIARLHSWKVIFFDKNRIPIKNNNSRNDSYRRKYLEKCLPATQGIGEAILPPLPCGIVPTIDWNSIAYSRSSIQNRSMCFEIFAGSHMIRVRNLIDRAIVHVTNVIMKKT